MKSGRWLMAVGLSLLVHGGLLLFMYLSPKDTKPRSRLVAVAVVKKKQQEKKKEKKQQEKKQQEKKKEKKKKEAPKLKKTRTRKKRKGQKKAKVEKKQEKTADKKRTEPKKTQIKRAALPQVKTAAKVSTTAPNFGLKFKAGTSSSSNVVVRKSGGTLIARPSDRGTSNRPRTSQKKPGPPVTTPVSQDSNEDAAPAATMHQVRTQARVLKRLVPKYPKQLERLDIEGRVKLELRIDEKGRVTHVKVLKSLHPLADKAAMETARKMRFSPATLGGRPIAVKIPYVFTFVMD